MFTGLIEEIGIIDSIKIYGNARKITIRSKFINSDIKIDDSIAIDGVCLTVIDFGNDFFVVEVVEETTSKTNLKNLRVGSKVNLERASRFGDRIGGHIVQGHIDCIGTILSIENQSLGVLLNIEFPYNYAKYIVEHGSICVNGISLTVARLSGNIMTIAIIPHTWAKTSIHNYKSGNIVNLEFDLLAKYVENMLKYNDNSSILSKFIDQPNI